MWLRWLAMGTVLLVAGASFFAFVRENRRESDPANAPLRSVHDSSQADHSVHDQSNRGHSVPLPESNGDRINLNDAGQITRRDSQEQIRWTKTLDGYTGGVRPPHLLADASRVYLTRADGVMALNAATGNVLWQSPGPSDRLLLSGELLLATECAIGESIAKSGRWITARNVVSGDEVFRFRLPTDDFDPLPIRDAAGLFLVQKSDSPGGKGLAILLNRSGKVHHQFDNEVVEARRWGGSRLFLTGRGVVRLSAKGEVEWVAVFSDYEWLAGGRLIEIPGGELIALTFCQIADSGVRVFRIDPEKGAKRWEAYCNGLGVMHSKYSHAAEVEITGNAVRIISHGDGCEFVEVLDLASGRHLNRVATKR